MVFLKIFVFLGLPLLVWWLVALGLQKRGVAGNASHAVGIGCGLATLVAALVFIMQTTERLPQ